VSTAFTDCEGCGAALLHVRGRALCDDCRHEALWSLPGEHVRHSGSHDKAVCVGVGNGVVLVRTPRGVQEWPLSLAERIDA
jgi:hypothetical protein